MINSKWLPISAPKIQFCEMSQKVAGVECKISLSPYDIPQAVRGFRDEKAKLFVIEFKYLTDEPTVERKPDEFTKIDVGRNSNRVYRIKLDIESIAKHLENTVVPAVTDEAFRRAQSAVSDLPETSVSRIAQSYDLTRKAILNNRDQLFADFERSPACD